MINTHLLPIFIIMIRQIIATALLSTMPLNNNIEIPKYNAIITGNFTLNQPTITSQAYRTTTPNQNTTIERCYQTYTYDTNQAEYKIEGKYYKEIIKKTINSTDYTSVATNLWGTINADDTYNPINNNFLMLKLTANTRNLTTTINLNQILDTYTGILSQYQPEFNMVLDIYTSIDNLNYLLNISNITTKPLYTYQNEITNAQNGYRYEYKKYITNLAPNQSRYFLFTKNIELTLSQDEINYVAIFMRPTITQTNATQINYEWNYPTGLYNGFYQALAQTYNITLYDTYTQVDIVNIPGLMLDIITMPFSFISMAFNLTLFPGTNYSINISNLFLSIIAVFLFITLIRLLIKIGGSV